MVSREKERGKGQTHHGPGNSQARQAAGLSFLAQIVPSVLSRENIDIRDVKLSLISDDNCQSISEVRSGLG